MMTKIEKDIQNLKDSTRGRTQLELIIDPPFKSKNRHKAGYTIRSHEGISVHMYPRIIAPEFLLNLSTN